MKKIFLISSMLISTIAFSQFVVKSNFPSQLLNTEAYLYGFNGSKDLLLAKAKISNDQAIFKVDKKYFGMMRLYYQGSGSSVNLMSENKDISIKIFLDDKKRVSDVIFEDTVNLDYSTYLNVQQKQDLILPALKQIKDYYKKTDVFYSDLEKEIDLLSKNNSKIGDYPFLNFYVSNQKFFDKEKAANLSIEDYMNFFSKSNEYLETSAIMKPALMNFLNTSKSNVEGNVDKLLTEVNIETPRGQTVLSELIEIFGTYNMDKLKTKYLKEAGDLKCTINDRLANTIQSNKNVEIGAKFPNIKFDNPIHTKSKSLYDVKTNNKIVVFWSSTCSHCEAELPKFIDKYQILKSKNIEIIGFSLDNNLNYFKKRAEMFPWINDSEGKGWYSSYSDTYNISATPTYFILDANNVIVDKPEHVADVFKYLKIE